MVTMYLSFPLSPRNVEDLLFERGIDLCHETVRHWNPLGFPPTADCELSTNPTKRSRIDFNESGGTSRS